MVPEEVIPVAAAMAPEELTWKRSPLPTVKRAAGEESPIPMLPLFKILMSSVAPLLPVWKIISEPMVPEPEVERRVKVEVVPVPPITKGVVMEVVKVGVINVGLLLNTASPVPVSSEMTPASWAEVVAANWERGFSW